MSNWMGGVGFTGAFKPGMGTRSAARVHSLVLPQAKVVLARAEKIPTPMATGTDQLHFLACLACSKVRAEDYESEE